MKAGCRRALAAHISLAGLVALAGCAAAGPTSRPAVTIGADKYDPAKAFLSLEQIGPAPILVEGSEQPDRSIPPQALERYLGGHVGNLKENAIARTSAVRSMPDISPECPECGAILEPSEGCVVCRSCGYSECS